jgi:hypothetical protein
MPDDDVLLVLHDVTNLVDMPIISQLNSETHKYKGKIC